MLQCSFREIFVWFDSLGIPKRKALRKGEKPHTTFSTALICGTCNSPVALAELGAIYELRGSGNASGTDSFLHGCSGCGRCQQHIPRGRSHPRDTRDIQRKLKLAGYSSRKPKPEGYQEEELKPEGYPAGKLKPCAGYAGKRNPAVSSSPAAPPAGGGTRTRDLRARPPPSARPKQNRAQRVTGQGKLRLLRADWLRLMNILKGRGKVRVLAILPRFL